MVFAMAVPSILVAVMVDAELEKSLRRGAVGCCAGQKEGRGVKRGIAADESNRPARRNDPGDLAMFLAVGARTDEAEAVVERVLEEENDNDEVDCRGTRNTTAVQEQAARLSIAGMVIDVQIDVPCSLCDRTGWQARLQRQLIKERQLLGTPHCRDGRGYKYRYIQHRNTRRQNINSESDSNG
jgi:hypothetical protein